MPRAADALQERRDRARRTELADQVDFADIDAELERSGRHQRLQLSRLEALFGVQPLLLGQTAVMRGHLIFAEPLGQLTGYPFGHPPGIGEDQGGLMPLDQLGQSVVNLLPDFTRHDGFERGRRHFEGEVARPAMAGVDDPAFGARPDQKARDCFDRFLGRRQADAQQPIAAQSGQAFER